MKHKYETSNCPHCFSSADTWFDRSCTHDENGNALPYEDFPFRCSDCGRNVDAPRSYYGLTEIEKIPFEVYLPATKADQITGEALDAKYIETVEIPVHKNYDDYFLTPEAHLIIEGSKLRSMFKAVENYEEFMNSPHVSLDGLTPNEALQTHDGQRACIVLVIEMGLYHTFNSKIPNIKRPLRKL